MLQFFSDLREQISFFYTVLEYLFYFFIGFLFLVLLKFFKSIISSLMEFLNKLSKKENYLYFLKKIVFIFIFIFLSILIGKGIIFIL